MGGGGGRPSPGAATYDWLAGSENRSAARPASIAAPGDGRAPDHKKLESG
jgi:hypothetical protein